jgi:hypothetical protein
VSPLGPVPFAVVIAASMVIMVPLLRPGYVLAYDMVFAPRMPVTADTLGLGSPLPRAVPSDLVVALASHVVTGQIVQKAVLLALLVAAGLGCARLAPGGAVPRAAAGVAYMWTPFVAERLLLGQWTVLVGYAGLPWLVYAAHQTKHGGWPAWARLAAVAGVMCLGGAPAWILAAITMPFAAAWGTARMTALRQVAGCAVILVVFALPWAVPALLRPGGIGADPSGATAFRPRADTPLGVAASVLSGGGIWNAQTVPAGRSTIVGALAALVVVALGIAGVAASRRAVVVQALAVPALLTLGFVLASAWEPAARAAARLPGGALLRDSPRLLAVWLLLIAVGFGATVSAIGRSTRVDGRRMAALCSVLPVVVLPSLAWGVSGRLTPVDYPRDFSHVQALLAADSRPGAVAVLPFQTYRRFAWNGGRTSLDPVPRWLDRTVVVSSDLPVDVAGRRVVVRGEDRLAARVSAVLAAAPATELGRLGVRWAVVDAVVDSRLLSGLRQIYHGSAVQLYEVPDLDVARAGRPTAGLTAPRPAVIAGHAAAAALLIASLGMVGYRGVRRLLRSKLSRPADTA